MAGSHRRDLASTADEHNSAATRFNPPKSWLLAGPASTTHTATATSSSSTTAAVSAASAWRVAVEFSELHRELVLDRHTTTTTIIIIGFLIRRSVVATSGTAVVAIHGGTCTTHIRGSSSSSSSTISTADVLSRGTLQRPIDCYGCFLGSTRAATFLASSDAINRTL